MAAVDYYLKIEGIDKGERPTLSTGSMEPDRKLELCASQGARCSSVVVVRARSAWTPLHHEGEHGQLKLLPARATGEHFQEGDRQRPQGRKTQQTPHRGLRTALYSSTRVGLPDVIPMESI